MNADSSIIVLCLQITSVLSDKITTYINEKYFLYSILVLSAFFQTAVAQNYVSTDCETMTEEREALQHLNAPKIAAGDKVFYICNDMGRNGYYEQKQIGRLMGNMASLTGLDFVAAIGDIHHFYGVASVDDPLWMTNFELIYAHPGVDVALVSGAWQS